VLAGKYQVERVLGVGGMGVVVAAHHIDLDQKVALKFLLPSALKNPEAVARFSREARAAVKIKSEYVARVSDVGHLANGAPYMVMEYLEGGDLDAWIRERGPLSVEQAVEFVLQACEALAEAHALGIVHRDLKPANLFCIRRADGLLSIKVLDFGISKMLDARLSGSPSMTRTASAMGSPLYMSPEQMRSSKDVDALTDIWALGVVLFELITGRPAFSADTVMELAIKVASEPAPSIRSFRPDVPEAIEAVIHRCLEKEASQRYPNVAELALALLPFGPKRSKSSAERISRVIQAAGLSTSALAVPPSPLEGSATRVSGAAATVPPVTRTTFGSGRSKVAVAAVFVVVSVLGVAVVATLAVRHWGSTAAKGPETHAANPTVIAETQAPPPGAGSLAPPLAAPTTAHDPPVATTATPEADAAAATAALSNPKPAKAVKPPPGATLVTTAAPVSSAPKGPNSPVTSDVDPLSRLRLK
jgi:serine/threonine-protein kinase